jgi:hypothetical protein
MFNANDDRYHHDDGINEDIGSYFTTSENTPPNAVAISGQPTERGAGRSSDNSVIIGNRQASIPFLEILLSPIHPTKKAL